jgi:hypothetical protein
MEYSRAMVELTSEACIEQFVRQVRNIIWRNIFAYYFDQSFQLLACITLAMGIINLSLYPLSASYCLLLAALCFILCLVLAVKHKPTMLETAHHIDRHFNAQALMITAVELLSSEGKKEGEFNNWILYQAAQACNKWRFQKKRIQRHQLTKLTALAATGFLVGVFFIIQPGATPLVNTFENISVVQGNTVAKVTQSSSLFAALREEKVSQKKIVSIATDKNSSVSINKPLKNTAEKKIIPDTLNEVDQLNLKRMDNSIGSNQNNRHNVDGIGAQADSAGFISKDNKVATLELKRVKITVPTIANTQTNEGSLAFEKQKTVDDNAVVEPVLYHRKQDIKMSYKTGFSPRQQQYITAYFNKRHAQK